MEQDEKVSAAALGTSPQTAEVRAQRSTGRAATPEGKADADTGDVMAKADASAKAGRGEDAPTKANNVRKIRIERMVSKAELARRANLSVLTIDRVERGYGCRMDTKRKILEALGLSLADRVRVFGEEE